ncbi:hypothetical protein MYX65_00205 [Acidobacteria bacterium AH-259-L09]|nr:hypothetical protein [Acidobacteria bacterium AH-259-L09]
MVVPGYLLRHHGIEMGEFERRFFSSNGDEVEIDLYAEGRRKGRKIVAVGEVKSRIYARQVEQFALTLASLKKQLGKSTFPIMFGYYVHPSGTAEAKKHDIELIASYQR